MQMKKQTVIFAVMKKDKEIKKVGNCEILLPKVNPGMHKIKWFDDNKLIRN